MANQLRIAVLDPSPYRHVWTGGPPSAEDQRRLTAAIRRHLPGVTASLLAEPRPSPDRSVIEWHTDLRGQPTRLGDLPLREGERARQLLGNRLLSLADLADRWAEQGSADAAAELRNALRFPGEELVYVVGGQPVITFWGYVSTSRKKEWAPSLPSSGPPVAGVAPYQDVAPGVADGPGVPASVRVDDAGMRAARPWRAASLVLVLLLLGASAFALHLLFDWGFRWPPWGPDYAALLVAAKAETSELESSFAELRSDLASRVETCRSRDALASARADEAHAREALSALEARLSGRLALCPLLSELDAAHGEGRNLVEAERGLAERLAAKLDRCRQAEEAKRRRDEDTRRKDLARKKEAKPQDDPARAADASRSAPTEGSRPSRSDGLPPCPGERTPEEAPDVAIVLDASGSMAFPASAAAAELVQAMQQAGGLPGLLGSIFVSAAGGPSRLDEAKRGVNNVVRPLPDDVDVGVTVLQDCPRPDNLGFFGQAERGQLYSRVSALRPARGTPLGEGLVEAGRMVDGVNAPGVIVVISDGEDSCGADPCATARRLRAEKPRLTINVVDIIGDGAATCMAQVTGGKVLQPKDGLAFERTIRQAVEDVVKPAHCP